MLRQIKPAMKRGDEWRRLSGEQRKRKIIQVEMQNVEFACNSSDLLEHGHVKRVRIADRTIEPERARPDCFEPCRGDGIAAGKQRDIVTLRDKLLRQPRNHALGAA